MAHMSIITPVLNGAKYLEQAIDSVLNQTLTEWEWILMDDGSSDESISIVERYRRRYPEKIRLLKHAEHANLGQLATRIAAAEHAGSNVVALLDQDDVWEQEYLKRHFEIWNAVQAHNTALTYGPAIYWHPGSSNEDFVQRMPHGTPKVYPPGELLESFLAYDYSNTPIPSSTLLRRDVLLQAARFGHVAKGLYIEDQFLWWFVAARFPIATHEHVLARYRQHPDSSCSRLMRSIKRRKSTEAYFLRKIREDLAAVSPNHALLREGHIARRLRQMESPRSAKEVILDLASSTLGPVAFRRTYALYRSTRGILECASRHLRGRLPFFGFSRYTDESAPAKALNWIRLHEMPDGGIQAHSRDGSAYPEVSGYLVPTLLDYGERELAARLVRWLISVQRGNGSFSEPWHGVPYVFDTAQALRGLLGMADAVPGAADAARRAADYLRTQAADGGAQGFGNRYSGKIPEAIQLYALPPLLQAAQVFGRVEYRDAALRCLEYYTRQMDALDLSAQTHFLAYQLEALIDLGQADRARPLLNMLAQAQTRSGAVRGLGGHRWVCSSGLAQLAVCWYKLGEWEPADRAVSWLEAHQRPGGGLLGSYGRGAVYYPNSEISWALKFFLDAHLLRVPSYIKRFAGILRSEVGEESRMAQAILEIIRPRNHVAEIGCGKGPFLKLIRRVYPDVTCIGVDICPELAEVPPDIPVFRGRLERIPFPDDKFDVVFAVEAVEHSPNLDAAVSEMARVTRPGGWVLIGDKERAHWGRFKSATWERWPDAEQLRALLSRHCDQTSYRSVSYGAGVADGLFLLWQGQKRQRAPVG